MPDHQFQYPDTITIKCHSCRRNFNIRVEAKDRTEWYSPNPRLIQYVFPYLSPDDRELLLTNTCGDCFDRMFNEDGWDEDEDEDEDDTYEVLVGNIGSVYRGNLLTTAKQVFDDYANSSKHRIGRSAGENVVIYQNGEEYLEYVGRGNNDNPNNDEDEINPLTGDMQPI